MFKKLVLTVCTCLSGGWMLFSQNFAGDWAGKLNIQGTSLNVVFHVMNEGNTWKAKMDSPDQQVFDIPIEKVAVENGKLLIGVPAMRVTYEAKLTDSDSLKGEFKQGDFVTILSMGRMSDPQSLRPKRPQEPKPKFDYTIRDVEFKNEQAGITLAGTLTVPKGKGPFPAVILVSGSGPQDRNEEILGHKPFWVIADYFAKNGIAVLRYDDRGVGGSKGNFEKATTLDFTSDAEAAFSFLRKQKSINSSKTGVIGHSEGGMVAPLLASKVKEVAFIVLLAGPGIPIDQLMLIQIRLVNEAMDKSKEETEEDVAMNKMFYEILLRQLDNKLAKQEIDDAIRQSNAGKADADKMSDREAMAVINEMTSPWFRYFISYNPATVLEKVSCPILAVNGTKDIQVTASENLDGIRQAAERSGNKNVEVHAMENLNHLMQTAKTGSISEYSQLEETFAPSVLQMMTEWIKKQ